MTFTLEEWAFLDPSQKKPYRVERWETFRNMVSVGRMTSYLHFVNYRTSVFSSATSFSDVEWGKVKTLVKKKS